MFARIPDTQDAIGGYFGLEPARREPLDFHAGAAAFQSGRAAFLALLEARRPQRVHLPWYLCDSMDEPLRQCGVEMRRYAIDGDFRVAEPPALGADDWLLYVNYFGLCDAVVDELVHSYPPSQFVVDNSQAFFAAPTNGLATVYSPRKFFGVPDGGYLVAPTTKLATYARDTESVLRSRHLMTRLALGAEAGYAQYVEAEQSLCNQPARRMSRITEQLLAGIDYADVRRRRRRNFDLLQRHLAPYNELRWNLREDQVPLCYPFLVQHDGLREELIRARVYVPRYWPDVLGTDAALPQRERRLAADLLPLPIDQRCEPEVLMRTVVTPLLAALQG